MFGPCKACRNGHGYLWAFFSTHSRKKVTVICLGLANILGFMALALMGPIYPIIVSISTVNNISS